jgi:hypothetical protein
MHSFKLIRANFYTRNTSIILFGYWHVFCFFLVNLKAISFAAFPKLTKASFTAACDCLTMSKPIYIRKYLYWFTEDAACFVNFCISDNLF